jgi:hypothetical protein
MVSNSMKAAKKPKAKKPSKRPTKSPRKPDTAGSTNRVKAIDQVR